MEANRNYLAVASCGPRTALGTVTGEGWCQIPPPQGWRIRGLTARGLTQGERASSCSERPLPATGLRVGGSGWCCTCWGPPPPPSPRGPPRGPESQELPAGVALPAFANSLVVSWRQAGWSRPSPQGCEKPGSLAQRTPDHWQFQILIPLSKQATNAADPP